MLGSKAPNYDACGFFRAAHSQHHTLLSYYISGCNTRKSDFADCSGVPVRTIQQYEQRQKNINKAQAEYLVVLAKVLCCEVGDLIEKIE